MGSASEDIQDQSGDARSKTTRSTGNSSSLDVGLQSVSSVLQKDQVVSEDDYAPKVRKPYTISKQRERWTEEEHNKFLEALKLYGRAWRRIEEHVGTKTAVQIRSHAQKFFSKVVRESSSNEESIVKPIEIPPPRPKRKPAHPYPRKMVSLVKTGSCLLDELKRSASPNLSISGQENQSPTSVLSRVGSDVTDSNMPNGSLSPVSSAADDQPVGLFPCETVPPPEDNSSENGMSSPSQENDGFTQDEEVLPKLELFPEDIAFVKERSNEVASTQSLKLFGKTLIIKGSSSPNWANFNSQPPEETDERPVQTSWNLAPGECAWNDLPCGSPALYYRQFPNGNSNTLEVGSTSLPRWTFYGEVSYPFLQLHNPIPDKEHVYSDGNEGQGFQNDGSRAGSDNRSVNTGGDDEKTGDVEPQSHQSPFDEEENEPGLTFGFKPRNELPEKKKNEDKSLKGFVPYKRSLANRDNSVTSIVEEREERRIRLCL